MILEGVVTTLGPLGELNVAPMGPLVEPGWRHFVLRPFRTSTTYRNLAASGEAVIHVVDDVLLLARAAIGLPVDPPTRPAVAIKGRILVDSCRYYEVRVVDLDDRDDRTTIRVEALAEGRHRDAFGLNRAKHAVVEAAILATRLDFLSLDAVRAQFDTLAPLIEKTGGPAERAAFDLLAGHLGEVAAGRESAPGPALP